MSLSMGMAISSTTNIPALSQTTNRPSAAKQAPAPAVIGSIREVIKQQFGVAKIPVVSVTEQNWPDGCLGLPKAEEICTMALVPGWRVEVSDKLQTWFYHTDLTGKTIRFENPQRSVLPQPVASRQFPNLNGLTYLTSAALADYPTTTYQSQSTAIQFIDLEKQSLPKSLRQSIASWESLITPVK
jgi:hypothetical protein